MQFEQHGSFKIWTVNNLIISEVHGTWNQVAAENYSDEFQRQARTLSRPWAHIVYLNDWELCSPDVFPVINDLVAWCIANGLTRAVNIFSPSYIKEGFVNKMVAQQQGNFTRVVVDNEKDALDWLESEGFTVNQIPSLL